MKSKEIDTLIIDFLKGELNSDEENRLLDWVKEDGANKNLFLKQQELFEKELTQQKDKKSIDGWKRLQSRIISESTVKPVISLQNAKLRRVIAIAAAFVFGIIISSLVITLWPESENTIAQQTISTPYGARTHFQLPDGSTVWLNSGSKLSYPVKFAKNRHITLEGEAFFDVEKGRPFIVSTNYGDVQVKGTSFNVKAFDNEAFETTLVTGLVQIKELKTGNETLLHPGYQATDNGNTLVVSEVETALYTSWKEGKLIFRNDYLPAVAMKLERWYNVNIILDDDPRLAEINFSGTIEMESFPEVMELLKTTASISYTFNEKTRTIRITKI